MKFRKLLILFLAAVSAVALSLGLAACGGTTENDPSDDDGDDGENLIALTAPQIALEDTTISWTAVENASGYDVYEGDSKAASVTETSYVIDKTAVGAYVFKVKALGDGETYSDSPFSNAVTYTIAQLAAPQITITGSTISWTAVQNANYYEIFADGKREDAVMGCSYNISLADKIRGKTYVYTVKANSTEAGFLPSDVSNAVNYTVPLQISVIFPSDYPTDSQVTVSLYDGDTLKGTKSVSKTQNEMESVADFDIAVSDYVAKASGLAAGYVATWADISEEQAEGTIEIIKTDSAATLTVGTNSVTLVAEDTEDPGDEVQSVARAIFTSGETSVYSLITTETDGLVATSKGNVLLDSSGSNGIYIGTLTVRDGETVIIDITGSEAKAYSIELKKGEELQPVKVSAHYRLEDQEDDPEVKANKILGSCKRTLTIDEAKTYTFFFTTPTMGERTITLKINDVTYTFTGGENSHNITLQADTYQLEFEVEGSGNSDGTLYPTFFVYPEGQIVTAS